MSESIWIPPESEPGSKFVTDLLQGQELQGHLKSVWDNRNPGTGGRGWSEDDDTPVFEMPALAYDRLQKFCVEVLGLVKFKTCDIYVAPLSRHYDTDPDTRFKTEIYFRAGAYRPLPKKGGGRPNKDGKRIGEARGVNSILDLRKTVHEPLYYFIRGGEPADHYDARTEKFLRDDRDSEQSKQMNAYVDYRIVGTIITMLAKCGPDAHDVRASLFWESARDAVNGQLRSSGLDELDGLPDPRTRDALNLLVKGHNKGLILEDAEIAATSTFAVAAAQAERLLEAAGQWDQKAKADIQAQFSTAWTIWKAISSNSAKICSAVRARLKKHRPLDVIRFLCEARPRSYIPWLRSATLSLDPHGSPILHPNLDRMIAATDGLKNKVVDVITKDAYELAARALLSARRGKDAKRPQKVPLQSMILIPFAVEIGDKPKLVTRGFLRLMNRMNADGSIFDYGNRVALDDEEDRLASAVQTVLREGLSDGRLFHLPVEAKGS